MSRPDFSGMKVMFRVDASFDIGVGHVMRCLTLADELRSRGAECGFLCRQHPGHLVAYVQSRGHVVHALPMSDLLNVTDISSADRTEDVRQPYASWLGVAQMQDADDCIEALGGSICDWLIVDHYALDARWESRIQRWCRHLMVIDDLADRPHQCELLLDQTLGREKACYAALLPVNCSLLCGSQYALLRPEFGALRAYSLSSRADRPFRQLLVTMGGVDKTNVTGQVLSSLKADDLPLDCRITVVMGPSAPWLEEVSRLAERLPWSTTVISGADNMAQLMADSDLCIGAAGATSWERCCLGLPTLMLVLADNQRDVARSLECAGAVQVLNDTEQVAERLPQMLRELVMSPIKRAAMSHIAAGLVDGMGVSVVLHHLERGCEPVH